MISDSYYAIRSEAINLLKILRTGTPEQRAITHLVFSSIFYGMKKQGNSSSLSPYNIKEDNEKFFDQIAPDISRLLKSIHNDARR